MDDERKTEKRRTRRNYSMIFRFIQIIMAMVIVFFLSFFITIVIKAPHPIDYIKSEYFDDKSTDKIIDDYEKEKKNTNKTKEIESNKNQSTDKNKIDEKKSLSEKIGDEKKHFDGSTISGKIDRIDNIKQAVAEKIRDRKNYLTLDEIPRSLRQAIIAVEDSKFYTHKGYDIFGIARATVTNVEAGQIEEGGSTITQQLVKNLFLTQDKSFTRKFEELFLAMSMEKNFTKDQILELYLNTIYFGSGYYGIYDAAIGYFGVEPKDLTTAESAMLAGLPNAPSLYSPYVNFMLAKKRQLIVIDAMVKSKILTSLDAEKAKIETIKLANE